MDEGWITVVNEANPFIHNQSITSSEYIELFDCMLYKYPYDMNLLANRQCLSGVNVIEKYIKYNLDQRKKKKGSGCVKMSTAFETGQGLFNPLCKKNAIEGMEYWKAYPQKFDTTLHEGKSNKINHELCKVNRAANESVRNSDALIYPKDGKYFYCPLNTKDLKSAGEQNVLADNVIITEETNADYVYKYLKELDTKGPDKLVLNGFIIKINCNFNLEFLITLKTKFPHVTSKYYRPYILIYTKKSILIKYSDEYKCLFSPAEVTEFSITFPDMDILSLTAKELDRSPTCNSITSIQAAKNTVAINNLRASAANKECELQVKMMESCLGITCHIEDAKNISKSFADMAVVGHIDEIPHQVSEYFNFIDNRFKDLNKLESTNELSVRKIMLLMYPTDDLLFHYKESKIKGCPFERERCITQCDAFNTIKDYIQCLLSKDYSTSPELWNFKLWAIFGEEEACCEDGVVLDSSLVEKNCNIVYNACFTVDFLFKNAKQPKSARFIKVVENNNDFVHHEIEQNTLIGCLITEHEILVKNSNHCRIEWTKIGNHYNYCLHFIPKNNNIYKNIKIHTVCVDNVITVVINGTHNAHINLGTKLANAFGQKNVNSKIKNLRDTLGYTRDGRIVYPQLVYSDTSLISRILAGQVKHSFNSNDLAITKDGKFIALLDFIDHVLHPFTNIKLFDIKMDTLSNINGCDSQNLPTTSYLLRESKIYHKVIQSIGFLNYAIIPV